MLLMELPVVWINHYTDEDKKEYTIRFGDNRMEWPEKDEDSKITLDLHAVQRFNPHDRPGITTVNVYNEAYAIKLSYLRFRKIMDAISPVSTPDQFLQSKGHDQASTENDTDKP